MDVKWVRDGDGAAVEHGEKRSYRRRRSGGERGLEKGNPEVLAKSVGVGADSVVDAKAAG